MNNVDIFSATTEKKMPTWVKFVNTGDSFQGTYVGKIIGTKDGFGNSQIIYQFLKNGQIHNIGFGENKKIFHRDMDKARFGQIIGVKYKGKITVINKVTKKPTEVKDYGLYIDPKIVDTEWLRDNAGNMPTVIHETGNNNEFSKEQITVNQEFSNFGVSESSPVPSNDGSSSITPEDKMAVITKLAYDKLGVSDPNTMKEKIMEVTGVPFIVSQYDKIINVLNTIGA